MKRIEKIFIKYKEIIKYLIFGILTTAVNFSTYYILGLIFGNEELLYLYNNAIAWLISVFFAYFVNKIYVFTSKKWELKVISIEIIAFLGARLFSLVIEEVGLWFFVDLLNFKNLNYLFLGFNITGQIIAKLLLAFFVVVLNYFFSKFFIFKKESTK